MWQRFFKLITCIQNSRWGTRCQSVVRRMPQNLLYKWEVKIGTSNGSVTSSYKPLAKSILTRFISPYGIARPHSIDIKCIFSCTGKKPCSWFVGYNWWRGIHSIKQILTRNRIWQHASEWIASRHILMQRHIWNRYSENHKWTGCFWLQKYAVTYANGEHLSVMDEWTIARRTA